MATTSLWHVSGSLKTVTDYVENPEKTLLGASVGVHYYFFMAPPPLPLKTAVCQGALTIPHDLMFVYSAFAEVIFGQIKIPLFMEKCKRGVGSY